MRIPNKIERYKNSEKLIKKIKILAVVVTIIISITLYKSNISDFNDNVIYCVQQIIILFLLLRLCLLTYDNEKYKI